jgi:predicted transcriptional regulator
MSRVYTTLDVLESEIVTIISARGLFDILDNNEIKLELFKKYKLKKSQVNQALNNLASKNQIERGGITKSSGWYIKDPTLDQCKKMYESKTMDELKIEFNINSIDKTSKQSKDQVKTTPKTLKEAFNLKF